MAKCTGIRCPMQVGYKVDECNHKDCPYRTEPITNADRIRSMSDEELARWLVYVRADMRTTRYASIGEPALRANIEWLQQPAEEDE